MTTNICTTDRYLSMRLKAFSCEGVRDNLILVEADTVEGLEVTRGCVRVWDAVAGAFTSCHSLTARAIARIRRTYQAV